MDIDQGTEVAVQAQQHQPVMQWELRNPGRRDRTVRIQVGTLADGGWYVRHRGFGSRRFGDKKAAWQAVTRLMKQHEGSWEQAEPDSRPFLALLRPDGSRVLYDNYDDECLYGCWGDQQDQLWERYEAAIDAGQIVRRTEGHALLEGFFYLIEYTDPVDGSRRYALTSSRGTGDDYRIVDYPDQRLAESEYERQVIDGENDEFPYKSSDVAAVTVDRRSRPPEGLTALPSGEIIATDDLEEYNRIYGLPPRMEWPLSPEPGVAPGAVSGMTADPRDWGPAEVDVYDVTPAAWDAAAEADEELRPNALALAVLPDGRQLLAAALDGGARVWNVNDGTSVVAVSGHSEWVLSVALAALPDGKTVLATGGKDGLARIWSVREGTALQEIKAHRHPVNSVAWAFPPDDVPWLITGSDDATVGIWDAESGLPLRTFKVGMPSIHIVWSVAAAVLANGHVCVVAGVEGDADAGKVHVWDATTGTELHELAVECGSRSTLKTKAAVTTLADRSFRVAAVTQSVLRVWDGHTGEVVRTLPLPDDKGNDVALATLPDLRVVAATADGQQALVYDTESGDMLTEHKYPDRSYLGVASLATRPDGGLLLAFGAKNLGQAWVQTGSPARVVRLNMRW